MSVRVVRPRPLDNRERIPVFWAGQEAPDEIKAVDGGALYRYLLEQENIDASARKRSRPPQYKAPKEVGGGRRSPPGLQRAASRRRAQRRAAGRLPRCLTGTQHPTHRLPAQGSRKSTGAGGAGGKVRALQAPCSPPCCCRRATRLRCCGPPLGGGGGAAAGAAVRQRPARLAPCQPARARTHARAHALCHVQQRSPAAPRRGWVCRTSTCPACASWRTMPPTSASWRCTAPRSRATWQPHPTCATPSGCPVCTMSTSARPTTTWRATTRHSWPRSTARCGASAPPGGLQQHAARGGRPSPPARPPPPSSSPPHHQYHRFCPIMPGAGRHRRCR